jgi:hypothetical protein
MSRGYEGKWPRIGPAAYTGTSRLSGEKLVEGPEHFVSRSRIK